MNDGIFCYLSYIVYMSNNKETFEEFLKRGGEVEYVKEKKGEQYRKPIKMKHRSTKGRTK